MGAPKLSEKGRGAVQFLIRKCAHDVGTAGGKRKGTYYNLADEIVINYLLKDVPANEHDAIFRYALRIIGEALQAFVDCADALIADAIFKSYMDSNLRRAETNQESKLICPGAVSLDRG